MLYPVELQGRGADSTSRLGGLQSGLVRESGQTLGWTPLLSRLPKDGNHLVRALLQGRIKALVVSRSAQGDEPTHKHRNCASAKGCAQHGHKRAVRSVKREGDRAAKKGREQQHDDHG